MENQEGVTTVVVDEQTMTVVTLVPKVDRVMKALREASERQGGTLDAFANNIMSDALATVAKAKGREVISKLGEKLVKWGHAGLTADQIQLRIEQEKKKSAAFHALALELDD